MSALEDLFGNLSSGNGDDSAAGSSGDDEEQTDWDDAAREKITSLFEQDDAATRQSTPDLKALQHSLEEQREDAAGQASSASPDRDKVQDESGDDGEGEDDAEDHLAALYETDSGKEEKEDVDFEALRRAMATSTGEDDVPAAGDDASARLNWLVDFVGEEDAPPPAEDGSDEPTESTPADEPSKANDEEAVSRRALDDMAGIFHNKVLMGLLQRDAVDVTQAVRAVRQKKRQPDRPLWDVLANLPDVDSQEVFVEAANAEGIRHAEITENRPTTEFLETVLAVLPTPVRKQFMYLGLLPYAFEVDEEAMQQHLVVASHYPTHPYVKDFVEGLDVEVELRYAPEATISECIEDVQKVEAVAQETQGDGLPTGPLGELLQARLADDETSETDEDDDVSSDDDETVTARADAPADDEQTPDAADSHPDKEPETRDESATDAPAAPAPPAEEDEHPRDDDTDRQQFGPEAPPPDKEAGDASAIESDPDDAEALLDDVLDTPIEEEASPEAQERPSDEPDLPKTSRKDQREAGAQPASQQETAPDSGAREGESAPSETEPDEEAQPVPQRAAPDADEAAPSEVQADEAQLDEAEEEEMGDAAQVGEPEEAGEPAPHVPSDEQGKPKGLAAEMKRQEAVRRTQENDSDEPQQTPTEDADEETEPAAAEPATVSDEALDEIKARDRVVAMLLSKEIVTAQQALQAHERKEQAGSDKALWRVLAAQGDADCEEAVYAEAADLYAFQNADFDEHEPDADFSRSVVERFDEELQEQLLEMKVVPYKSSPDDKKGARRLSFITHDPTLRDAHNLLHELPIERFDLLYAPEEAVSDLIAEAFPKKNEYLQRMEEDDGMALDLGMSHKEDESLVDDEELEAEISRSKLINLFEATLVEGVRQGASDVHIYPNADKKVEIHFRVDGRLQHWHTEEKVHPEALLAVIKDNAMNVDRFERDAAQDGFIQRKIDDALIRFRVSVLPIANASQDIRSESIVIRILDDRKVITDLGKLGLLQGAVDKFEKAIRQPNGMVIMTGPTGSGKSTTLVAAMHNVVTSEVNALTVEDPVEYIINGVRQIKLNHKLSLDGALRSILRHDPDIVMVGEMRDRETAELAIKLANTGHLTFSTLHTNDAPSAISRLYKMGIEPFLIAYAINLVVAQRLIRTLCPDCKVRDEDPDTVLLKQLGFSDQEIDETTFYQQGNDPRCGECGGMGFSGRRAIAEALYFNREIRHMIVEAEGMINEEAVREEARKEGLLTLQDSAREIVKMGETGVREMIRVVASEGID
jgi:type IV pilus assembly protein PilB